MNRGTAQSRATRKDKQSIAGHQMHHHWERTLEMSGKQCGRKSEKETARESSGLSASHTLTALCGCHWVSPDGRKAETSLTRCLTYPWPGSRGGWNSWVQLRHTQVLGGIHLFDQPHAPRNVNQGHGLERAQARDPDSGVGSVLLPGWLWVRYFMSLGFSFRMKLQGRIRLGVVHSNASRDKVGNENNTFGWT